MKELITAIEEYSLDKTDWFKNQKLDDLIDLPFQTQTFLKNNWNDVVLFFDQYQKYFEERSITKQYPIPYYKAKQICCDYIIKLEEGNFGNNKYVFDWLSTCFRSTSDADISLFFKTKNVDAEVEIKKILFDNSGKLRDVFNNAWEVFIENLCHWFIKRFDFRTAKAIIKGTRNNSSKKQNLLNLTIAFIPIIIIVLPFIPFIMNLFNSFRINFFTCFPFAFPNGIYNINVKEFQCTVHAVYNTPLIIFELFAISFFPIYYVSRIRKNELYLDILSPRLLIGIILGYLSLFAGNSYWNLAVFSYSSTEFWSIVWYLIIALISLSIVYVFISFEVKKSVKTHYKKIIRERSLAFFKKCVWSSFLIGIVFIDLSFISYLKNVDSTVGLNSFADRFHVGIVGIVDPLMLLFLFPLALIFGVVIKFILEEKSISSPFK